MLMTRWVLCFLDHKNLDARFGSWERVGEFCSRSEATRWWHEVSPYSDLYQVQEELLETELVQHIWDKAADWARSARDEDEAAE